MSFKRDLRRLAKLTKSDGEQTLSSRSEELRSEGQRVADGAATGAIAAHVAEPDPHPQYLTASEGLTDPTTTQGDLIYRGALALTRLGIGGAGEFLRVVGGVPAWAALTWAMIGSTPTTLAGYGIVDAQPLDADLTAIAALSTTTYGRSLLTQASAAAARSTLGLGTAATANTGDFVSATANVTISHVLAGPTAGTGPATFRALTFADLPAHTHNYTQITGTPIARASTAAGQSIANNTVTIVDFGTVGIDTAGAVTTGAAWKFTAPANGNYSVSAAILFSGSTGWADGEFGLLSVYKNGSLYAHLDRKDNYGSASSVLMRLGGSTLVDLSAGDYIDIRVQQNSGAAITLNTTAAHNHVSIVRA